MNFIKYSCGDSDWVITRQRLTSTKGGMGPFHASIPMTHLVVHLVDLKYSDILGLEKSIDAAYEIASQRLFDVFFDKFKLLDHLLALKHYFLLGYGDFADTLMDALAYALLSCFMLRTKKYFLAKIYPALRTPSTDTTSLPPSRLRSGLQMLKETLQTCCVDLTCV